MDEACKFTLFNDEVQGRSLKALREEMPYEARVDVCHTRLYVFLLAAAFAALVASQFLGFGGSVGVGRVTLNNVPYATFVGGLPSDAVCTPAVPLVAFSAFATLPVNVMEMCTRAPALAQQCLTTTCNNYPFSRNFVSIISSLCAVSNTSLSSSLRDVLAKNIFTPTVASQATLEALLAAEATSLLARVRGEVAATLDGRRLFDATERPVTSAGLSASGNVFGLIPVYVGNAGASSAVGGAYGRFSSVRADRYSNTNMKGSCYIGVVDAGFSGSSATVFTLTKGNPFLIVLLAVQPGCVPWVKSGTSRNGQLVSRSTTCVASAKAACNADAACAWNDGAGYCGSENCENIPSTSCTRNPRCQLTSNNRCETAPVACAAFFTRSTCHSTVLCSWVTGTSECKWTTLPAGTGPFLNTLQTINVALDILDKGVGSGAIPVATQMDFVRSGGAVIDASTSFLYDTTLSSSFNEPFLQAREDGQFQQASIVQGSFALSGPNVKTITFGPNPLPNRAATCDCIRDYSCTVPNLFYIDSFDTIGEGLTACTVYDTVLSLPMSFFTPAAFARNWKMLTVDLMGTTTSAQTLASAYGVTTLESAFRKAFILGAAPAINHATYYAAVGPVTCSYLATIVTTPVQALTIVRGATRARCSAGGAALPPPPPPLPSSQILGIIGGLTAVLQTVSGFLAKWLVFKPKTAPMLSKKPSVPVDHSVAPPVSTKNPLVTPRNEQNTTAAAQTPPGPLPPSDLPPGWTRHSDEKDEWFSDADGVMHWALPRTATSV
jgi:hypothetical protein